ncbi:hypothetical protein PLICRDRAFT_39063 [Plicaturopsis crispa FD-325 SS-3]|nr:hypothetical protein PLICRDRAFT_39063 [Plicaturopsis crispa FD-325 SS-3]
MEQQSAPDFTTTQTAPVNILHPAAFPGSAGLGLENQAQSIAQDGCTGADATLDSRLVDELLSSFILPDACASTTASSSTPDSAWTPPDFTSLTALYPPFDPSLPVCASTGSSSSRSSPVGRSARSSSPTRKSRSNRPRVELAPDQPPTIHGKPRARVFVACQQCRSKKMRCDGTKPACLNCTTRVGASSEATCCYDPTPKRRGPDKLPGRKRTAKEDIAAGVGPDRRRRRRRREDDSAAVSATGRGTSMQSGGNATGPQEGHNSANGMLNPTGSTSDSRPVSSHESNYDTALRNLTSDLQTQNDDFPAFVAQDGQSSASEQQLVRDEYSSLAPFNRHGEGHVYTPLDLLLSCYDEHQRSIDITVSPTLDYSRKTWWDALLCLYTSHSTPHRVHLTTSQRANATRGVTNDLRHLFHCSNPWFSFFHIPSFFNAFLNPDQRVGMQPSLVYALLAISTLFQSSEAGRGEDGRARAVKFANEAQASLEASYNAGWFDETLAQAAWLIAFFEICTHPELSGWRITSSMKMMDNIIRTLSLTFMDADDPRVTVFARGAVPALGDMSAAEPRANRLAIPTTQHNSHSRETIPCACDGMTLDKVWPGVTEHAPQWTMAHAWNTEASEVDIRKESSRRLCWSAMMITAGLSTYTATCKNGHIDLFINDPANYALLFPGDEMSPHGPTAVESIWALHYRVMLLWQGCLRMHLSDASAAEKGDYGVAAWREAEAIEAAFARHTCKVQQSFMSRGQEYLFNVRMLLSQEFQRFIPTATANVTALFHREKTQEWLSIQLTLGKQLERIARMRGESLYNLFAERPFLVFWFMGQVARAITLWTTDNSIPMALDVAISLMRPIDQLTALWPCPGQRVRYEILRDKLMEACYDSGVEPPAPSNLLD